jgi:hypothetical protein
MNCSANTPAQLSFFSESLNEIVCSASDRRRSAAAEAMDQMIRDRGFRKGEGYKYVKNSVKVPLICPKSHHFEIRPDSFKNGVGCSKCYGNCPGQAQDEFEQLITERSHTKGLGYAYVNAMTKTALICSKGHNFNITPTNFKSGQGCPKCGGVCPEQARYDFERMLAVRGYSKGDNYGYVDATTKLPLLCPKSHSLMISPHRFKLGKGCAKCSGNCPAQAMEGFEQSIAKRGYAKGVGYQYVGTKTKVSLVCGDGHSFCMTPHHFKRGVGCPSCVSSGFNQCIPAILYYIAFYPQPTRAVYKIGITNRTAADRYKQCKTPYRILMEKQFESGLDCLNEETMLIRKHRKHRCKDTPVDGLSNKELFDIDVLGLDVELYP